MHRIDAGKRQSDERMTRTSSSREDPSSENCTV
jgi:hypothetical protein